MASSPLFLVVLAFLLSCSRYALAQIATLPFDDCFNGNASQKMSVSTVYGQIVHDSLSGGRVLNVTVLGETGEQVLGLSNYSNVLATLFTTTTILTMNVFTNSTNLCTSLRPPSPLPTINNVTNDYCPLASGPFGLSAQIPWNSGHELTTLSTLLRAVDPFGNETLCLNVATTALNPGPVGSIYGNAAIILWSTVALAIAYWLLVGIARIASAWGRGTSRGSGLWSKIEGAGFVLASAISGERLAKSPALMRFCTPSFRDIIFHTQWCAALAMIAVQWPPFVYPLLAQARWATLSYNISITQDSHERWNPLSVPPYNPPSNFVDQLNDPTSSIYIDSDAPNYLFMLPDGSTSGISSFAYTVGLRPEDLFGVCLALFLAIIAVTILLSLFIWMVDWLMSSLVGRMGGISGSNLRSPRFSTGSKDMLEGVGPGAHSPEENRSFNGHFLFRPTSRLPTSGRKWWKFRPDITSFHANVLHGNLVRILVLFHFPVTIFSCYQMTLGRSIASLSSFVLAILAFILFSVLLPIFIIFRLTTTSTNKLYDETRTLLFLGPLYNHYRHGSQLFASLLFATNLAFGIIIGCGQKSGTAQAIIILVIEVISALVTSIWLPWGSGASMGLISFLFCVARIVIAVLLVILTPTISIGNGAGGWVAYGILIILALVYLAFLLMLIVKIVEALVRIFGGIGFDRSRHVVDSGLLGACGMLGCCGPRKRRRTPRSRYNTRDIARDQTSEVSSYVPPTTNFTPKGSSPSMRSGPPASVLRPEHALRPYREDSDDESGYIMGAWQPFPRAGYNAVSDSAPRPQTPRENSGNSGFSRVGGGRAHFETPYAIASGSTQTFPSVERGSTNSAQLGPVFDEEDPPPTASVANIARQPNSELPPGAMQPAHIRTKSQTAIIEHAVPPRQRHSPLSQAVAPNDTLDAPMIRFPDEDDDSETQPKKKHWYQLRKPRRHSEGDTLARVDLEQAASPPAGQGESGGRSFVVIRDRKRGGSDSPLPTPKPGPSSTQSPGSPTRERPQSFVVLRGSSAGQAK